MPLNNQVPARDPMSNKMIIEDIAELMLSTIPCLISAHLIPKPSATSEATPAESINIIWLDPSREASP